MFQNLQKWLGHHNTVDRQTRKERILVSGNSGFEFCISYRISICSGKLTNIGHMKLFTGGKDTIKTTSRV